jgi:hypothetical protein
MKKWAKCKYHACHCGTYYPHRAIEVHISLSIYFRKKSYKHKVTEKNKIVCFLLTLTLFHKPNRFRDIAERSFIFLSRATSRLQVDLF